MSAAKCECVMVWRRRVHKQNTQYTDTERQSKHTNPSTNNQEINTLSTMDMQTITWKIDFYKGEGLNCYVVS